MAEKSMWDKFKELNENDDKNGTDHLQVSPHFVRADMVKAGGHVTMGIAPETFRDLAINGRNLKCLLLVIDMDELEKVK